MRQLTAEEIDHAPEWATHYFINGSHSVVFESDEYYQTYHSASMNSHKSLQLDGGMDSDSIPIPGKEKPTSEADLIHEEVCRIAKYLYEKFYYDAGKCELAGDTRGVLSQIDGMLTGLVEE